jgi:hypothetical protein
VATGCAAGAIVSKPRTRVRIGCSALSAIPACIGVMPGATPAAGLLRWAF